MTILVLMATHNGLPFLPEQVQSIRNQQGVTARILAYDDQSTDTTAQWLDANGIERLPTRAERLGPAGAFIHLLLHAPIEDAEAIALADQDDLWDPKKLALQRELLHRTPTLAGVSSNVMAFWPDGRERYIDKGVAQTSHDHLLESAGPGCTYMVSRSFLESLRAVWAGQGIEALESLVRGRPYHDWLLYACARAMGWQWTMLAQPLVHYRQHANNVFGVHDGWHGKWARLMELRAGSFQERQFELVSYVSKIAPNPHASEWVCIAHAKGVFARFRRARWLLAARRRPSEGWMLAVCALLGIW